MSLFPELVVESPSGMRHAYSMYLGVGRTLCGRRVPKARGWFGPIDRPADCARCVERAAAELVVLAVLP